MWSKIEKGEKWTKVKNEKKTLKMKKVKKGNVLNWKVVKNEKG